MAKTNQPKPRRTVEQEWLCITIESAFERKFYGKLTVIMEEGIPRRVIEEKSLKPPKFGEGAG